jgi:hypothetical protein
VLGYQHGLYANPSGGTVYDKNGTRIENLSLNDKGQLVITNENGQEVLPVIIDPETGQIQLLAFLSLDPTTNQIFVESNGVETNIGYCNNDLSSGYYDGSDALVNHIFALDIAGVGIVERTDFSRIVERTDLYSFIQGFFENEHIVERTDFRVGFAYDKLQPIIDRLVTRTDAVPVTVEYAFDLDANEGNNNKFMKMSRPNKDADDNFLERNCDLVCLSSYLLDNGTMSEPLASDATQVQGNIYKCKDTYTIASELERIKAFAVAFRCPETKKPDWLSSSDTLILDGQLMYQHGDARSSLIRVTNNFNISERELLKKSNTLFNTDQGSRLLNFSTNEFQINFESDDRSRILKVFNNEKTKVKNDFFYLIRDYVIKRQGNQ